MRVVELLHVVAVGRLHLLASLNQLLVAVVNSSFPHALLCGKVEKVESK